MNPDLRKKAKKNFNKRKKNAHWNGAHQCFPRQSIHHILIFFTFSYFQTILYQFQCNIDSQLLFLLNAQIGWPIKTHTHTSKTKNQKTRKSTVKQSFQNEPTNWKAYYACIWKSVCVDYRPSCLCC